jgi:mannobiose 2-epimerase
MILKNMLTKISILLVILLVTFTSCKDVEQKNLSGDIAMNKDTLLIEIQTILDDEFQLFYPLSIDTLWGGFFSDINYQWKLEGKQDKMIVSQARHVWSTSNALIFYPNKPNLLKIAKHGYQFLKDVMWDNEHGGIYELVNRKGEPIKEYDEIIKTAYGNSFAIYGLAAYYAASKDPASLKLAQETFYWLENHSYDLLDGGYFQFQSQDGTPYKDGYRNTPPKDHNSSIHLLEAFTELYKVWPDELLKERLSSLLILIRDIITTDKGYMNLFFTKEWEPVSYRDSSESTRKQNYYLDHVSFGHDIETAYLMLEASEVLGLSDDNKTLAAAKLMVDHTIKYGWDSQLGGIYDGGYYFNENSDLKIVKDTKEWWVQSETLNSLAIMSELFPDDELNYLQKFFTQWDYIKQYLLDNEHGGWYWGGIDAFSNNKTAPKGSIWKVNYHTSRSLINISNKLTEEN